MGSDRTSPSTPTCSRYFNPRSPDGERPFLYIDTGGGWEFQSTLPGWGATTPRQETPAAPEISIHAPRMGSDSTVQSHSTSNTISIHAPRMGSDSTPVGLMYVHSISIHAPRMGSDRAVASGSVTSPVFQSTLPGWGATSTPSNPPSPAAYFNPRSPDGQRLRDKFNIPERYKFQSTLPGWGATVEYEPLYAI